MEGEEDIILLLETDSSIREVGFVRLRRGSTLCQLREEVERDEIPDLCDREWVFVGPRSLPFSSKQEERHNFSGLEVKIRFSGEELAPKRIRIDEMVELEAESVEPEVRSEARVELTDARLKSKSASRALVISWKADLRKTQDRMLRKNRKDRFSLISDDVNGKPRFRVWCEECSLPYDYDGKSKKDIWNNFVNHHCESDAHKQLYKFHLMKTGSSSNNDAPELSAILEANQELVNQTLTSVVAAFSKVHGVNFNLYKESMGDYSSLHDISIVCETCNTTLQMFPKTGDLKTSMKQHILHSVKHRKAARAKEEGEDCVSNTSKKRSRQPMAPVHGQKRLTDFMHAEKKILVDTRGEYSSSRHTVCHGFWLKQIQQGDRVINVKSFIDDQLSGTNWYADIEYRGSFETTGVKYEIEGTFWHRQCLGAGFDFPNFMCPRCERIPFENDLRGRMFRNNKSDKV